VLIPMAVLRGVAEGRVDLAYRRWTRPTVKAGGRLRTAIGELAIDEVDVVDEASITEADATRAGFADRAALLASLRPEGTLHRVRFHVGGPDARSALRERAELDADELTAVLARLARFDAASRHGPWTEATLRLIAAHPARRAPDLAAMVGRETAPFKTDVRKLKELGLTESLEVGYRLSPRGRAVLGTIAGSTDVETA
jgi:hypothetical protein